ncbi:hypothetical protein SK3146_04963 [Paenibacillus konkukensis]|uniref:Uncharacterized protein n=1 Tax=Paenibacillus konkukensis TaxID=2020716 RepID=A0ABY4RSZ3_9BACL|nr:hypothetical protein SK3146_04963 [Paenibacillus konkukensis]
MQPPKLAAQPPLGDASRKISNLPLVDRVFIAIKENISYRGSRQESIQIAPDTQVHASWKGNEYKLFSKYNMSQKLEL